MNLHQNVPSYADLTPVTLAMCLLVSAAVPTMASAASPADMPRILRDAATARANPLPDFSYAGYGFGIADIPTDAGTVINVADYGAKADDNVDDSQAVLKALAVAHATKGKVTLRFPAGRFIITSKVNITRGDFVLEGAGRGTGGTTLFFERPLKLIDESNEMAELREYIRTEDKRQVEKDRNVDYFFSEYSWDGGFVHVGIPGTRHAPYLAKYDKRDPAITQGISATRWSKTLTVADASQIKPGQIIQVQWFSTDPKSGIIKSLYGATDLSAQGVNIGSRHWDGPNRPLVAQATRVVAVNGNVVTLGDPLLHAVSADVPATIVRKDYLTNVGIQNLRIDFPNAPSFGHHLEQGYNAIYLTELFDGWVRDVTINNADSSILTNNSASLTLRDITTTGDRSGHYAVHVGATHNVLVKGVTVANHVVHPFTVNTQSTRAVYTGSQVLIAGRLDQHSGANHQNLFDNLTIHIVPKLIGNGKDQHWGYDLWDGSGAGYWKPNHGLYNTSWNLNVVIDGGAAPGETVTLRGVQEGVGHRVVGVHGNRPFKVDYQPAAYVEAVNGDTGTVPSLYDYQLAQRKK